MTYSDNLAVRYENAPQTTSVLTTENYIGDLSFDDYRVKAAKHFPFILPLIDLSRVHGQSFANYIERMNEISWEFEDQSSGGRGAAYNVAQQNSDNRRIGTLSLLKYFSDSGIEMLSPDRVILDALGGDGTIARFLETSNIQGPKIISGDLSSFMVNACLTQNLPCIRQSADKSLFADSTLDGVLIAYGSHHLDAEARKAASSEAFRTLKNGGRFVLHDFETGTPGANWFNHVVHPYSRTGHPHPHFSKTEMSELLKDAGFSDVQVFSMSDPFVLKGATAKQARETALLHLYNMYDLIKITGGKADILRQVDDYATRILGDIVIQSTDSGYTATVPRQALVAVGTKLAPRHG